MGKIKEKIIPNAKKIKDFLWKISPLFLIICIIIIVCLLIYSTSNELVIKNAIETLKVSVTILISMIGFSVSIYVFLNNMLQNRKNDNKIEKEVIQLFQQKKRQTLGKTIVLAVIAVSVELIVLFFKKDLIKIFSNNSANFSRMLCFFVIAFCAVMTLVNILILGNFAFNIINYDEGLRKLAIELREKEVKSSYYQSIKKGDFLNLVNNVEVITERLIENHMHAKFSTVYESNFKRAICDGITDAGDIKSREQLAEDYKNIIDYRNLLLQDTAIEDSSDVAKGDEIKSVTNRLFQMYLKNELLTNINVNNLDVLDANLSKTSFNNSFLQKIHFRGETILQNTDFRNSTLNGITFERAECENINFSNTKLIDVKFNVNMNLTRSIFEDADLSNIGIFGPEDKQGPPIEFYNSVFRSANMGHLEIFNVSFNFSNLSKVRLADSKIGSTAQKMNNVTFKYSDLSGADFLRCIIERCNFENADLNCAVLTYSEMTDVNLTDARLNNATLSESKICKCTFDKTYCQNASFKGADIEHSKFNYSTMISVDFSGADLKNVSFDDAVCRDALWVGTKVCNSSFNRCAFTNARIVGGNKKYIVISDCIFKHANFSESLITNIQFNKCSFSNCDFSNARLVNVEFFDCKGLGTVCTNDLWLSNVKYLGKSDELVEPKNGWRYKGN